MNRNELDVGLTRHVQGLDVWMYVVLTLRAGPRMPRHALVLLYQCQQAGGYRKASRKGGSGEGFNITIVLLGHRAMICDALNCCRHCRHCRHCRLHSLRSREILAMARCPRGAPVQPLERRMSVQELRSGVQLSPVDSTKVSQ